MLAGLLLGFFVISILFDARNGSLWSTFYFLTYSSVVSIINSYVLLLLDITVEVRSRFFGAILKESTVKLRGI